MSEHLVQCFNRLRALSWMHQTFHWQASGHTAFQLHLLFERLYGETLGEIDGFAEKLVGSLGVSAVEPVASMTETQSFVSQMVQGLQETPSAHGMLMASLDAETQFLAALEALKGQEELSGGMENFIEGVMDKHESHVYLLKQHMAEVPLESLWGPTVYKEE